MIKTLYLTRHAEPEVEDGVKGMLSQTGINQAHKLSSVITRNLTRSNSLGIIYSPSARCQQTAKIIAQYLSVVDIHEEPLRFIGIDKLDAKDMQSKYSSYVNAVRRHKVETPPKYLSRLKKMIAESKSSDIVAICNEINIRAVLQLFAGETYNRPIGYAECFKLSFKNEPTVKVRRINNV